MPSGKRTSVLIFSPSIIKESYIGPIEHYGPDITYAFIDDRDDEVSDIIRKAYSEAMEGTDCGELVELRINTGNFEAVLSELVEVKEKLFSEYGNCLDLYINISSGTHEFTAAAMFASMLRQRATAFRVDLSFSEEAKDCIREIAHMETPVSDPDRITNMENKEPDDEMMVFLQVVNEILKETKYPKYELIIKGLKERGAWSHDPEKKSGYGKTSLQDKENMYLKRHYLTKALESGWVERPSPNTLVMTDLGMTYLSVYGSWNVGRSEMRDQYCSIYPDPLRRKSRSMAKAAPEMHNYSECMKRSYFCDEEFEIPRRISDDDSVVIEHNGKKRVFRISME